MFARSRERKVRIVRFTLLFAWIGLLLLCVFDIGQSQITDVNNPLYIDGLSGKSILLRGEQFEPRPYNPAPRLFWGVGIPLVVLCLLFLGHDTWRRICPMSAVSQIPRWMGWQRKHGEGPQRKIVLLKPDSFLARHAILIQFALFTVGVTLRLTVLSAHPVVLFILTLSIFAIAFCIGIFYGGKTWCNYICPMNAVQLCLSGPRGLNAAVAEPPVSQSMCRKPGNKDDVSTCVGCNTPCPDVDMERNYWERLPSLSRRLVVYGYLGTVLGFIHGMFAASGDFNFAAAVWYDTDWKAIGFFPFGESWPIPRLFGSGLLMIAWVAVCMTVGVLFEKGLTRIMRKHLEWNVAEEMARHRSLTLFSSSALLILIFWVALPGMGWLPDIVVSVIGFASVVAVSFWLYRTWKRSNARYRRESLAASMRNRLLQTPVDWRGELEGRSIHELSADETYLLASLLPKLEKTNRLNFYQSFLTDVVKQGAADDLEGRKILAQLRKSCEIEDAEHQAIVNNLKGDFELDDDLLVSTQLRIESFKQHLEQIIFTAISRGSSLHQAIAEKQDEIHQLREDYAITEDEEEDAIRALSAESGTLQQVLQALEEQLQDLAEMEKRLDSSPAEIYLHRYIDRQVEEIITQIFNLLEVLAEQADTLIELLSRIKIMHPIAINKIVSDSKYNWSTRLPATLLEPLNDDSGDRTVLMHSNELRGNVSGEEVPGNLSQVSVPSEEVLRNLSHVSDSYSALVACRAAQLNAYEWADAALQQVKTQLKLDSTSESSARLTVMQIESFDGQKWVCRDELRAGRSIDNDWHISQINASRLHFRLFRKQDGYYCEDLGSTNGTLLDGKCLRSETARLPKGRSEIRVAHDSAPSYVNVVEVATHDVRNSIDRFIAMSNLKTLRHMSAKCCWQLSTLAEVLELNFSESLELKSNLVGKIALILDGRAQLFGKSKRFVDLGVGDLLSVELFPFADGILNRSRTQLRMACWTADNFESIIRLDDATRHDMLENVNMNLKGIIETLSPDTYTNNI